MVIGWRFLCIYGPLSLVLGDETLFKDEVNSLGDVGGDGLPEELVEAIIITSSARRFIWVLGFAFQLIQGDIEGLCSV